MGDGEEIDKGLINLSIEIADELSLGYQQQDKVADILMERVKPLYQRIEALQTALRGLLEKIDEDGDTGIDIHYQARLRVILEDKNENP